MVAVSLKKKKNFFQAEDGIRDVERSRGLGDVYKRQIHRLMVIHPCAKYGKPMSNHKKADTNLHGQTDRRTDRVIPICPPELCSRGGGYDFAMSPLPPLNLNIKSLHSSMFYATFG